MGVSRNPARPASGSPAYSPDDLPAYRGGSSAAPSGPVTLIYDSFTEAGTVAITAHTPDTVVAPATTPWAQNGTHYRVDSSGVLETASGGSNDRQCYIDGGIANGIASAEAVKDSVGLVFRHANTSNYWMAFNRASGGTQKIDLFEITAGALTLRGAYSVAGADRKLQVITIDDSISVYVDGVLRISHTSSAHQTATGFGFRSEVLVAGPGTPVADNFYVIDSTNAADLP